MTSVPSLPPDLHGPLINIRNTYGVLYICGTVSVGLLGLTTLQAWLYFRNYSRDSMFTKSLVAVVWSIEFVRSSFLLHASYYYTVANWGNPAALLHVVWSMLSISLVTDIVELIVQLYFARRIWYLSRPTVLGWTLTSLVIFLSLSTLGLGFALFVEGLRYNTVIAYEFGNQKIFSPLALGLSLGTNTAIMLSLGFLLHLKRTGISKTNHLINVLIFYTIQAGALIVVVDIVVIVLNKYLDHTGLVYIGLYGTLGNLYANSLLASLNARTSLRNNSSGVLMLSTQSIQCPRALPGHHAVRMRGISQSDEDTADDTSALSPDEYQLHKFSTSKASSSGPQECDVTKALELEGLPTKRGHV